MDFWVKIRGFHILLESADFNEIQSNLPDLEMETSNNERPLAQKGNPLFFCV